MDSEPPEPSTGSVPAVAAPPLPPQVPLLAPPLLSPAKRWKDLVPGAHPCSVDDLAAITAQLDLQRKDSIFNSVPSALNRSIGNPLKPPNHILAGKDIATTVSNLAKWGTMTEQEQRREVEKARALSASDKAKFRRLIKKINPAAQSLPATNGEDTATAADDSATTQSGTSGTRSPPRRRRRIQPLQDATSQEDPPAASTTTTQAPFQHIGLVSTEEQRAAILQQREEQLQAHRRRRMGEPAKKSNQLNDSIAQKAALQLLQCFSKSLSTVHIENEADSGVLDCQHTMVLITYCDVKPSLPQGGAPLTMQSIQAKKPTMRICAFGEQKTKAVLQIAGKLLSPMISDENRPNVDLEWIVKEDGKSYIDTMQQKIDSLLLSRAQPGRQTLTSEQVQLSMPAGEYIFASCFHCYTKFILTYSLDRYFEH